MADRRHRCRRLSRGQARAGWTVRRRMGPPASLPPHVCVTPAVAVGHRAGPSGQPTSEALASRSSTKSGRCSSPDTRALSDVLTEEFFAQYNAEPNTIATNISCASTLRALSGDVRVDRLHVPAIAAWRKQLPLGSSYGIHKVLKQILNYAKDCGYVSENQPSKIRIRFRNGRPRCHSTIGRK